jgi:hypothetical protein
MKCMRIKHSFTDSVFPAPIKLSFVDQNFLSETGKLFVV